MFLVGCLKLKETNLNTLPENKKEKTETISSPKPPSGDIINHSLPTLLEPEIKNKTTSELQSEKKIYNLSLQGSDIQMFC